MSRRIATSTLLRRHRSERHHRVQARSTCRRFAGRWRAQGEATPSGPTSAVNSFTVEAAPRGSDKFAPVRFVKARRFFAEPIRRRRCDRRRSEDRLGNRSALPSSPIGRSSDRANRSAYETETTLRLSRRSESRQGAAPSADSGVGNDRQRRRVAVCPPISRNCELPESQRSKEDRRRLSVSARPGR